MRILTENLFWINCSLKILFQFPIWIFKRGLVNFFLLILSKALSVSRVLKYPKKYLEDLTTFFISTWWENSKNMEEIEFSRWLFEVRLQKCKNVLPDGLNWLCFFTGSSKGHRENSISCIFLESPHQVDMKSAVKSSKHFFGYFNTLETHSDNLTHTQT